MLVVLPLSDADKKIYEAVKAAFEQHYIRKHNVIFERAQFNNRRQHEGETVEAYITAVHKLSENSGFEAVKEELKRDRIVVAIRDKRLSEQLQMDSDSLYGFSYCQVRQSEMVKKQQTILHSEVVGDIKANIDGIKTEKKKKNQK